MVLVSRTMGWLVFGLLPAFAGASCESTEGAGKARASSASTSAAGGAGANAGGAGATGGGDASGGNGAGTRLAAACATDRDCGDGLRCYTSASKEWGGMGPAKGYCSADCSTDATLCEAFDPAALCYPFSAGGAFCLAGCAFGPDESETFDLAKCHGREEVACTPVVTFTGDQENVTPACWPMCNSDADCGGGLWCDPRWSLCSVTAPQGQDVGAYCELNTLECKGPCKPMVLPDGQIFTHTCTAYCTVGAVPNCGWTGPGDAPAEAYCLTTVGPVTEAGGPSAGDMGLCVQLCDCGDDCGNPDLVCLPWSARDADLETLLGRKGHCGSPYLEGGGTAAGVTCG